MSAPYTVRDEAYGRVHDYSTPTPTPAPRGDNINHSYAPPNHDTARGWAFDDALEACIACTMIGLVLGMVLATVAARGIGVGPLGTAGVFCGAFVTPFLWPFAFWWRSPYRAYRLARWKWQGVGIAYHEAAIARLRPAVPAEPATPATVTRTGPDEGEMFYLQCKVVLARATVDPRCPRDAESAIRKTTTGGVPVVITKDEYKDVAGILRELGFMVGGEDQAQRNYALADAWQGKSVAELWAALKGHKALIMARAE